MMRPEAPCPAPSDARTALSGSVDNTATQSGRVRPRQIAVLQTGAFTHFLSATRTVAASYPSTQFFGLVREADLQQALATGLFAEVHRLPSDLDHLVWPPSLRRPAHLCVVPFEDRLGIRYWKSRLVPLRHQVQRVVSYNGRGDMQEWGRAAWAVNSLLVCGGGRILYAVYRTGQWGWGYLRRWVDIVLLFGLAIVALFLSGPTALWRRVVRARSRRRLPHGRRRVVLFIPSLGMGGAQRQLISFLKHLDRDRWNPEVVTLDTLDKFFEPAVRAQGMPITYLSPHCQFQAAGVVWQLIRQLWARPCDVLHSWLHHAVALGAIAGTLVGVPTIIGSLRSERPGRFPWFYPKWQRGIDFLTAPLHSCIIANSNAVREENRRWAFIPARKLRTVYNGIETDESTLLTQAQKSRLRADLFLAPDAPLVGIIGRLSREKDHATFLQAAWLISQTRPAAHFLVVGDGPQRPWIESEIEALGLAGKVLLLGERRDVMALIQLLDVLVLTSTSEGFPNVLLEAALARTPVVTTAAGGAVEVVRDGETGFVAPCGDAEAVARGVLALLDDPLLRKRLSQAARDRMQSDFSADQTAAAIQACYGRDS